MLCKHDFTCIQVHHDPTSGRYKWSRIIKVEIFGHGSKILIVVIIIDRIQNILPAFKFVFVLLLYLLPTFKCVNTVISKSTTASVIRIITLPIISIEIVIIWLFVLHFAHRIILRCIIDLNIKIKGLAYSTK